MVVATTIAITGTSGTVAITVTIAMISCAAGVVNTAGVIPALGEMGTTVVSAICGLMLCICVAGLIFDGPKHRREKGDGEIERKV